MMFDICVTATANRGNREVVDCLFARSFVKDLKSVDLQIEETEFLFSCLERNYI
jgi:hypothetical protein